MKILVASDKFKGSLTAAEACHAISSGLASGLAAGFTSGFDSRCPSLDHEIRCLPIADGGDGIARTLCDAAGGTWHEAEVTGPLGTPVRASFALIDDGRTAVIEMATSSGLALLGESANDPQRATTRGTGELILEAIKRGCEKIILGIGGSATNDGGVGMALALGYRFLDQTGATCTDLPEQLLQIVTIEAPLSRNFPKVTVACDVTNPLLGPHGCTRVYGPQKGITPEAMEGHEKRLAHLVSLTGTKSEAASHLPGSGAAGDLDSERSSSLMRLWCQGSTSYPKCSLSKRRCSGRIWSSPGKADSTTNHSREKDPVVSSRWQNSITRKLPPFVEASTIRRCLTSSDRSSRSEIQP